MKTAAEMTLEEFKVHLKWMRDYLHTGWHREDSNSWRNPKWRSGVITRHTLKQSMQRRKSKRKPNADI